jgi:hypothetical protein
VESEVGEDGWKSEHPETNRSEREKERKEKVFVMFRP